MIDVIIPVYNARKTLPLTLMSVFLQKIECPIQVTVIDDCSDESYEDILDSFRDYLSIFYYRLEENSGSGIAREIGLQKTNGEYVTFLDADDLFYDVDSLKEMYTKILIGFDVISSVEYDEARNIKIANEGDLHGKLYRRKFLQQNDIHFNETRFHEDNYFHSLVLLKEARNFLFRRVTYFYRMNRDSITKKDPSLDFERLEILLSNVRDLLEKVPVTRTNKQLIAHFLLVKYRYYNRIYPDFSEEQKEIFRKWILTYDPSHIDFIGMDEENIEEALLKQYS